MDKECFPVLALPAVPPLQKGKRNAMHSVEKETSLVEPRGLTERSVFHQPWWLDATTGGNWDLAVVKNGDEVIGEMPYMLERKGIWLVSTLPPLTRTLGPVIKPKRKGAGEPEWCHRMNITSELMSQIPECAHFYQLMDTRMSEAEAIAFSLHGFDVSVAYTMEMADGRSESDIWNGLRRNTRNWVRRAAEQLTVQEISGADAFVDFYDANLAARKRNNVYGSSIMRRLLVEVVHRKAGTLLGAYAEDGSLVAEAALVWDNRAVYYLLSSRRANAHSGAISLLIWNGMRAARERNLIFDFDGISTAGILEFLAGFGGHLVQRFEVERMRTDYGVLRTILRGTRMTSKTASQRLRRTAPAK
jgi:hypothetical protein